MFAVQMVVEKFIMVYKGMQILKRGGL